MGAKPGVWGKAAGILLWLWQMPQNLAGLAVVLITGAKPYSLNGLTVHAAPLFGSGVSLGRYIIIDRTHFNSVVNGAFPAETLVRRVMHEYGHCLQSRRYGWLYLLAIGLPSICGNVYSRITGKDSRWYYAQPWEAEADRLGGVDRSYLRVLRKLTDGDDE